MNPLKMTYLAKLVSFLTMNYAHAAKESFDRSKRTADITQKFKNNKVCNAGSVALCKKTNTTVTSQPITSTRKPLEINNRQGQCSTGNTTQRSNRSKDSNRLNGNGNGVSKNHDDLILRKRPGRKQQTNSAGCNKFNDKEAECECSHL